MRITFLAFILTLLLSQFTSCRKKPDAGEDYIFQKSVVFYVKDSASNTNSIGSNGAKFHPDSIKIYTLTNNKTGRVVLDSTNNPYGAIIYLHQMGSRPKNVDAYSIDATIYINFNQFDTNTLQAKKMPFKPIDYFLNNKIISNAIPIDEHIDLLTIYKR